MITLEQLYEIRLALHEGVYNDINKINNLINCIGDLDLFNIEYFPMDRRLILKIKKTNIKKKYNNYIHDVFFYNGIIQPVFNNVFRQYRDEINGAMSNRKCLQGLTVDDILSTNNANAIYVISTLLDNNVMINL